MTSKQALAQTSHANTFKVWDMETGDCVAIVASMRSDAQNVANLLTKLTNNMHRVTSGVECRCPDGE